MLRSLYSAISGLKNHQIKMDVVGNNIANVNTTGFKRSRVTFSTMLSQTMKGAGSPSPTQGGTNPAQVGLGSMVSSIDQIMTTGSAQNTGNPSDVMIQGRGFFVFRNAGQIVYGRAGAFSLDESGNLTDPGSGAFVMGHMWGANDREAVDWSQPLEPIKFKLGSPAPSDDFEIGEGNWVQNGANWEYTNPALINAKCNVSDSSVTHDPATGKIIATTKPTGPIDVTDIRYDELDIQPGDWVENGGQWEYTNPGLIGATLTVTGATFDSSTGTITATTDPTGATVNVTNIAGGSLQATLDEYSIDGNGVITGIYVSGKASASHRIGQLAIAGFANDAGLQNIGNSFYIASNNSGTAQIGSAGVDGRGTILASNIEMSNVDLSQEFTDMIVTQRGFQANSRVITVSDSLLQELIDLKRG
ncbi:Flagellar hook protein FlgE [Desulfitobacterium hafniense]|uniref:Flagellar hook protein FlgE n=1 Tax=Desulfitobacterium hafniense TaxID=49338 RepID=A0A098B2I2_DESHA|nr:flagellar hook-basal body complex protein [Desulfitobacterium hafniense]CDX03089.1 Flagellar hook protein FlgE [Desulfitobacterium hafniense]